MVVFDAYRVEGHTTEVSAYHNIQVVFTREAETADQYIEKFAHENAGRFDVSVATSDGWNRLSFWARDAVSSLPESWNRSLSG